MATREITTPLPINEARARLGLPPRKPAPAARTAAEHAPAFLYVVTAPDGTVKVGYATDPRRRLATLQSTAAQRLDLYATEAIDGQNPREAERHAHHILERHRIRGEWFRVHPEIALAAIRTAAFCADNGT